MQEKYLLIVLMSGYRTLSGLIIIMMEMPISILIPITYVTLIEIQWVQLSIFSHSLDLMMDIPPVHIKIVLMLQQMHLHSQRQLQMH